MSIVGVFTTAGISAAIDADNEEGFKIHVDSFGVSNVAGTLNPSITPNAGEWFQGLVSSRVRIDNRTVKVTCTIPQNAVLVPTNILEIYLYGKDEDDNLYLLCAGQPDNPIQYTPSNTTTFELHLSLVDIDLTANMVFKNTFPVELAEHNNDPNAHPEIPAALKKAGIYIPAGPYPFAYSGQNFDEDVEFGGTNASVLYGGVTFSAVKNGDELNGEDITFDGIKTVDEIIVEFNEAHPLNIIESDGTGLEVLGAGVATLVGGTYTVNENDLVYRDVDGLYKQALADGSIKSKVVGIAYRVEQLVRASGFFGINTGFDEGSDLFLSAVNPGEITNIQGEIKVGIQVAASQILIGISAGSTSSNNDFDAVVTDTPGFKNYETTQEAIDAVSSGARILVDKIDFLQNTLVLNNKAIEFMFHGPSTGWRRYLGTQLEFRLEFSSVPTSGTWRIEWNAQESADLAFNATALDVENEFNAFTGHSGVTVTGNFLIGFTVLFADLAPLPLPTFASTGLNEIQRFDLSDTPDDGTMRFQFDGVDTANYAWNDDNLTLEDYLEALPAITSVQVTGGFNIGYLQIEFTNQDGSQPKDDITVVANLLTLLGVDVLVNGVAHVYPIAPVIVQNGQYPASNLFDGITPVDIDIIPLVSGSPIGASTGIIVDEDNTVFHGQGLIADFPIAIDLNGNRNITIDMIFDNCVRPVDAGGLVNKIDYNIDPSFGIDREHVITVGTPGDYPDFASAYSEAQNGDRIVILEDQTITAGLVLNKEISIDFVQGAKFLVPNYFSGFIVQLFDRLKTNNMHIVIMGAGTWDQAVSLNGASGHHKNLIVELSGGSVLVTEVFAVELNCSSTFVDGLIKRGLGSTTSVLINDSGYFNHNIVIRDVENAINHTLFFGGPSGGQSVPIFKQEELVGVVDGVNQDFDLSLEPQSDDSLIVKVNSLALDKSEWTRVSLTVTLNDAPAPGQSVEAFYIVDSPSPLAGMQEVPVGVIDGINDTFALSGLPVAQESVIVVVNGFFESSQNWFLKSTLGASYIQFKAGSIPAPGTSLFVFYLINIPNPAEGNRGGFVVTGSVGAPVVLAPTSQVQVLPRPFQQQFIRGPGGGGGQTQTANPQIAPGARVGDVLKLKGVHPTDFPIFNDGNGIRMNGNIELSEGSTFSLSWDGSVWSEDSRTEGV